MNLEEKKRKPESFKDIKKRFSLEYGLPKSPEEFENAIRKENKSRKSLSPIPFVQASELNLVDQNIKQKINLDKTINKAKMEAAKLNSSFKGLGSLSKMEEGVRITAKTEENAKKAKVQASDINNKYKGVGSFSRLEKDMILSTKTEEKVKIETSAKNKNYKGLDSFYEMKESVTKSKEKLNIKNKENLNANDNLIEHDTSSETEYSMNISKKLNESEEPQSSENKKLNLDFKEMKSTNLKDEEGIKEPPIHFPNEKLEQFSIAENSSKFLDIDYKSKNDSSETKFLAFEIQSLKKSNNHSNTDYVHGNLDEIGFSNLFQKMKMISSHLLRRKVFFYLTSLLLLMVYFRSRFQAILKYFFSKR